MPACLLACLPACLFPCVRAFLLVCLLACLPASLLACLPVCLLSCLPSCLHSCLCVALAESGDGFRSRAQESDPGVGFSTRGVLTFGVFLWEGFRCTFCRVGVYIFSSFRTRPGGGFGCTVWGRWGLQFGPFRWNPVFRGAAPHRAG